MNTILTRIAAFVTTCLLVVGLPFVATTTQAGADTTPNPQGAVTQFWQYLYSLQSLQGCEGLAIAVPQPNGDVVERAHVVYGGTPLQAFIVAISIPDGQFKLACGLG